MNTRLMVLGLLSRQPRHGYGIQRDLEEMRVDRWADIQPGSIYQALKQLTSEGLIRLRRTSMNGHRLRAEFEISADGRVEFQRLLGQALEEPPHSFPSRLYTALAFVPAMNPKDALAAIERLIPKVQGEIESWTEGERMKGKVARLDESAHAVFENGRDHLRADLNMLERLRESLRRKLPDAPAAHPSGRATPRRDFPDKPIQSS